MPARLAGQVILNTRPAHQQAELSALLETDGAEVLSFPVIDIELADPARLAFDASAWNILLFVSRNAVDGFFAGIDASTLPPGLRYGVIGSATRAALLRYLGGSGSGLISSEPYNSEALLDAPQLQQVSGQRILILRGQQGRNLLGDELAARGAEVDYREVYRRCLPPIDSGVFDRLTAARFPTLVVLTSNEGMRNLFELVAAPAAARLRQTPWLLISERMRESAQKLGHNAAIIIAHSASDDGIRQSICDWVGRYLPGDDTT